MWEGDEVFVSRAPPVHQLQLLLSERPAEAVSETTRTLITGRSFTSRRSLRIGRQKFHIVGTADLPSAHLQDARTKEALIAAL